MVTAGRATIYVTLLRSLLFPPQQLRSGQFVYTNPCLPPSPIVPTRSDGIPVANHFGRCTVHPFQQTVMFNRTLKISSVDLYQTSMSIQCNREQALYIACRDCPGGPRRLPAASPCVCMLRLHDHPAHDRFYILHL